MPIWPIKRRIAGGGLMNSTPSSMTDSEKMANPPKQEREQIVVRLPTTLKARMVQVVATMAARLDDDYSLTDLALSAIRNGMHPANRNQVAEQRWASRTRKGEPRVEFQIRLSPALRARITAARAESRVSEPAWLLWALEGEVTSLEKIEAVEGQMDEKREEILSVLADGRDLDRLQPRFLESVKDAARELIANEAAQEHLVYGASSRSTEPQTKLRRLAREYIALRDQYERLTDGHAAQNERAIERCDREEAEIHLAIRRTLDADPQIDPAPTTATGLDYDEVAAIDDPEWEALSEGLDIVDLTGDPEGRKFFEAGFRIIRREGDRPMVDCGRHVRARRRPDG
jgi:hypothetical protein